MQSPQLGGTEGRAGPACRAFIPAIADKPIGNEGIEETQQLVGSGHREQRVHGLRDYPFELAASAENVSSSRLDVCRSLPASYPKTCITLFEREKFKLFSGPGKCFFEIFFEQLRL
jgi:hypothetical protein